MKIKPIMYLRSFITYLNSLNWTKDDQKKFIFWVVIIIVFFIALHITLRKTKFRIVGDIGIENTYSPLDNSFKVDATINDITIK